MTVMGEMSAASETVIVAEGVRKSFGGVEVLKGVDMEVKAGEVGCLIGPSGSGKSTFLRCINALEHLDGGRIRVQGNDVGYDWDGRKFHEWRPIDFARYRRTIGMVFQQFNLFDNMTALDNVACAPIHVLGARRTQARDRAAELLARVGLSGHEKKYPRQLSGGQQQRVAIARSLAMEPAVMLFDEPTSGLDPELVGEVLEVMRALAAGGMTMIVVTHEIGFAREVGDTVTFFEGGVVVESGPARDVIERPVNDRTREFLSKVL